MHTVKNRKVFIGAALVLLTLLATLFVLWLINRVDSTDMDVKQSDSAETTEEPSKVNSPGTITTIYSSLISTEDDFEAYIAEVSNDSSQVVHDDININWDEQNIVPAEFSISAGNSFKSITYNGADKDPEIVAVSSPEGCSYSAVQVRHVVFMQLGKDDLPPTGNTASYSVIKSQEKCPL